MIINGREIPRYGHYKLNGDYHESHYICPECFKSIRVESSVSEFEMNLIGGDDLSITLAGPKLTIRCDRCGDYMFDCDEKLVGPIILLNKKGYITQFCCEGHHVHNDPYHHLAEHETCSAPYIKFFVPLFKKGALAATRAIAADVYATMYKNYEKQILVNEEIPREIISLETYETVGDPDDKLYKEVIIRITNGIMLDYFDPDENIMDAKNYDILRSFRIYSFSLLLALLASFLIFLNPLMRSKTSLCKLSIKEVIRL